MHTAGGKFVVGRASSIDDLYLPLCKKLVKVVTSFQTDAMLGSKVALITGAAQGIGLATAKLLLRNGAKVSLYALTDAI